MGPWDDERGGSVSGRCGAALRDRAMLELFFSTGLRLSELCSLNRDLDLSRDEFSIRGKGEKVRVVFLSDDAKTHIKKYLAARKNLNFIARDSMTKDPLDQKILNCARSLAAMATSGEFQDDGSCN